MLIDAYKKHWDLKYTEEMPAKSFETFLSPQASNAMRKFIKEYPNNRHRLGAFVGNHVKGNIVFDLLIEDLLAKEKVKTRCGRFSLMDYDYLNLAALQGNSYDIILIDYVEPSIIPAYDKIKIIKLITSFQVRTKMIFLNIPTKEEMGNLPASIYDELELGDDYRFLIRTNE